MGARGLLLALMFFVLATVPACAIDCISASENARHANNRYAELLCASPELSALEIEMRQVEQALAEGMATGDRDILAAANAQWRSSYPPCWAGTAACITTQRDDMRARIRFLKGEPTASGTGERIAILPLRSKLTSGGARWYTLVQRFADPRSPGALSYNGILDGIIARNLIPGTPVVEKVDETYAGRSYLLGSLTVQYASSRFLSVEHRATYMQLEGGVDPSTDVENFNIDMRSGKLIDLEDFFPPDHLQQMEKDCVDQLIAADARNVAEDIRTSGSALQSQMEPGDVRDETSRQFGEAARWSFRPDGAVVSVIFFRNLGPQELHCSFSAAEVRRMALPDAPLP